jgi:hypothetical protein
MYSVCTLNTTRCPLPRLFNIELIFLLWVYWRFKRETVLCGVLIFTEVTCLKDGRSLRRYTD